MNIIIFFLYPVYSITLSPQFAADVGVVAVVVVAVAVAAIVVVGGGLAVVVDFVL